jgi:hypothetical protein
VPEDIQTRLLWERVKLVSRTELSMHAISFTYASHHLAPATTVVMRHWITDVNAKVPTHPASSHILQHQVPRAPAVLSSPNYTAPSIPSAAQAVPTQIVRASLRSPRRGSAQRPSTKACTSLASHQHLDLPQATVAVQVGNSNLLSK